jgi:hypothetical protein
MTITVPALPKRIYGYFDTTEANASYDPGLDVPCLYCARQLTLDDVRTLELKTSGRNRSYFYRVHQTCDEKARKAGLPQQDLDNVVWETIRHHGD